MVAVHGCLRGPLATNHRFSKWQKRSCLGYREEHVAASVKNFDVAEIDFVELSGHKLICSVVYGSQEELKLSSMSINSGTMVSSTQRSLCESRRCCRQGYKGT